MAELVYARDSKSRAARLVGSSPTSGTMHDEWLDLVDLNESVIGKKLRSEVYKEGLHNYRAINLFIKNSKDELWVPRRTANKALFPLGLDFSCAGHVSSGETYEGTLEREVQEELNLDIKKYEVRFLGMLTPSQGFACFAKNYEITMDTVPEYNPDDYCEYFWLTPLALIQRIEQKEYAKSGLPIAVQNFYLN